MNNLSLKNLNNIIDKIDRISDQDWKASLVSRKIKELEFHDRDRDVNFKKNSEANDTYEKFYGNKKYYKIVSRSKNYVSNWIEKQCKGKVFLDYACGNGGNAILAAKSGASLSLGFDISSISLKNARIEAEKNKLQNIRFFQADAENTMLPNESVDVIICSGMLHHLDLSYAFYELRRILKPGGIILAVEALDYNPLIKIYRWLTPSMRTDWEKAHILSLKDIRFAKRFFNIGEIKYWHVIGYLAGKFPFLSKQLEILDMILEKIPYLNIMAWMFTFELIKPKEK
jgi:ubiquinone/menaquinone biosynthesis C-methylase UbiE